MKWTWYFDEGQQRSHTIVTSDILLTGFIDGFMRYFDKETGALLRQMNLGSDLRLGITPDQDSDVNQMLFKIAALTGTFGFGDSPGILGGMGLSKRVAAEAKNVTTTVTTTTTSRTTLTTTTTSVSTTTQTVTSTTTRVSTTTATSTTTLATTSTVVSTAAPSTTTVTSEITETTGLPSTVTYAAVAVAVIAIIGAAVLATRRR